jgi:hypothetical protein
MPLTDTLFGFNTLWTLKNDLNKIHHVRAPMQSRNQGKLLFAAA